MKQDNPNASPTDGSTTGGIDPKLLHEVATRLAGARDNPPTVVRMLLKWPGTPLLLLVGVAGTSILAVLCTSPGSAMTSHWPIGFAAMILGALLRDLGLARRVARSWKPQSHFIDWQKVDEFTPKRPNNAQP